MKIQLDKLKMNDTLKIKDVFPWLVEIAGDEMKFVGISYYFVTDIDLVLSINKYEKGFNPEDYEKWC